MFHWLTLLRIVVSCIMIMRVMMMHVQMTHLLLLLLLCRVIVACLIKLVLFGLHVVSCCFIGTSFNSWLRRHYNFLNRHRIHLLVKSVAELTLWYSCLRVKISLLNLLVRQKSWAVHFLVWIVALKHIHT